MSPLPIRSWRDWWESLPQWAREFFEERAGILEYEANYPRRQAEELAWGEVQGLIDRHSPKSE